MNNKNILATYIDETGKYNFAWLEDEELEAWIDESKILKYTQVEVIRVNVVEEIYESEG